ncbi:hypothetical protein KC349_g40 [Hortaea werneckii]|nr:hypothetical protein KC349_g40 [Hortaea werneckii]
MYNYHVATSSIAALLQRFIAIQSLVNSISICSCVIHYLGGNGGAPHLVGVDFSCSQLSHLQKTLKRDCRFS